MRASIMQAMACKIRQLGKSKFIDFFIVIILFFSTYFLGTHYIADWKGVPRFYQDTYGPSVMQACGHGFVGVYHVSSPELDEFLHLKRDSFDCRFLPAPIVPSELDFMALHERYLMEVVAWVWKWQGIAWSHLLPLYGFLFATTMVFAYGLFRLGMEKLLALVGVFLLVQSGLFLKYLPHLRDYSTAPFVFGYLWVMGIFCFSTANKIYDYILAALIGVILGVGLGFRMDLLIYIPLFIGACLIVEKPLNWKHRFSLVGVYLVCLWLSAFPLFSFLAENPGKNFFHVFILGLCKDFNQALGVRPSSLYSIIDQFSDNYIYNVVLSYADRIYGVNHPFNSYTAAYSYFSQKYFWLLVKYFPSDLLIRVYASILSVLRMSYEGIINFLYQKIPHVSWWKFLFQIFSVLMAFLSVIIIRLKSSRNSILFFFLILFLTSYPVVQFDERHYFYLVIVSVFIGLFVLNYYFLNYFKKFSSCREGLGIQKLIERMINEVKFILYIFIILFFVLFVLRVYQEKNIKNLIFTYMKLNLRPLGYRAILEENKIFFIRISPFEKNSVNIPKFFAGNIDDFITHSSIRDILNTSYLVLDFNQKKCSLAQIGLKPVYQIRPNLLQWFDRNALESENHPETLALTLDPKGRAFIPVYDSIVSQFKGVELSRRAFSCLTSVYAAKDIDAFPLLLSLTLPSSWSHHRLYQTLGEVLPKPRIQEFYIFPSSLKLSSNFSSRVIQSAPVEKSSLVVKKDNESFFIKGKYQRRYPYLIQFKELKITDTDLLYHPYYFVTKGMVKKGGVQIGLTENNQWSSSINVLGYGYFQTVIKITHPGNYAPLIAHAANPGEEDEFYFEKIGWVKQ